MSDAIQIPLSGQSSLFAVIDAADVDRQLSCQFSDGFVWFGRIADLKWKPLIKDHTTYAVNHLATDPEHERELRLHRVIMCASSRQLVDHRDGNGLNCCRENLRLTDSSGNAWNRAASLGFSSRFKGVSLNRMTGKYEASIRFQRKKKHLGLFTDEESAAHAYDEAAMIHFGEFARLNFPLTATT